MHQSTASDQIDSPKNDLAHYSEIRLDLPPNLHPVPIRSQHLDIEKSPLIVRNSSLVIPDSGAWQGNIDGVLAREGFNPVREFQPP